jgi:hypothetical protein
MDFWGELKFEGFEKREILWRFLEWEKIVKLKKGRKFAVFFAEKKICGDFWSRRKFCGFFCSEKKIVGIFGVEEILWKFFDRKM